LKMGPMPCPEPSVKDYHLTLHNNRTAQISSTLWHKPEIMVIHLFYF
jgi:hypothetical protein